MYFLQMRRHGARHRRAAARRADRCSANGPVEAHLILWGPMVASGEWWRLLGAGFLHANLLHLGTNMLSLFFIGRLVEPAVGTLRTGLIYFVSLAAGSLGVIMLEPGRGHARSLGRDLRAGGRAARDRARPRHRRHAERHRADDPAQSRLHVLHPRHLDRRAHRRPDRRRGDRLGDPRARQAPPPRATTATRASPRSPRRAFVVLLLISFAVARSKYPSVS